MSTLELVDNLIHHFANPEIKQLKLHPNTRRAIATSNLFARIIYDYFNDDKNACDVGNIDVCSILQNMVLLGGATRDFLIGRNINDIDITLNNRELNKIQLIHLQQYHNNIRFEDCDKSQCALWKHYLKKFDHNQTWKTDDFDKLRQTWKTHPNEEKSYFQNLDYIINAEFLVSILRHSEQLADKLELTNHDTQCGWYEFKITKDIIYDGINLKEQECDILELKDRKKLELNFKDLDIDKLLINEFETFPSLAIAVSQNEEKAKEFIPISIPIYSVSLRDCFGLNDLSVNTTYIQLSNCLGLTKNDHEEKLNNDINYDWTKYIKNGTEMDGLSDIKRKILTHSRPREVALKHPPDRHFWRIMKFAVRMPDWKIDESLIKAHKELYSVWICNDEFLQNSKNKNTIGYGPRFLFGHKKLKQWERILQVCELFDFNDILIGALNRDEYLRTCWISALNEMQSDEKDEICVLLKKRNYVISIDV